MVVLVNGTPEIQWVFFSITSKLFVKVRLGSSISRRVYGRGFWIFSLPLYSANGYLVVWGRVSLDSWDPSNERNCYPWDFTPFFESQTTKKKNKPRVFTITWCTFGFRLFNLSLIFFRENLLVLEKYQCPTFTEKTSNLRVQTPDRTLNPSASVSRPDPTKIWKNELCWQMFLSWFFFVWTNLKKRDTKKQSPLLSHLPFVKGEPFGFSKTKITGGCLSLLGQHFQTESH